jgi:hypothetical protein
MLKNTFWLSRDSLLPRCLRPSRALFFCHSGPVPVRVGLNLRPVFFSRRRRTHTGVNEFVDGCGTAAVSTHQKAVPRASGDRVAGVPGLRATFRPTRTA